MDLRHYELTKKLIAAHGGSFRTSDTGFASDGRRVSSRKRGATSVNVDNTVIRVQRLSTSHPVHGLVTPAA